MKILEVERDGAEWLVYTDHRAAPYSVLEGQEGPEVGWPAGEPITKEVLAEIDAVVAAFENRN